MTGPASRSALALSVLTAAFAARVAGQALVAFFGVHWLPAMDAWLSGLLPYPVLLPVQLAILVAQFRIDRDLWRGRGFFARRRPGASRALQWFACVYALSMVVRFAITRSHAIPVVFHWVLAAYLFLLGRLMVRSGSSSASRRETPASPEPGSHDGRSLRSFSRSSALSRSGRP